jgi:hypothetical protein
MLGGYTNPELTASALSLKVTLKTSGACIWLMATPLRAICFDYKIHSSISYD